MQEITFLLLIILFIIIDSFAIKQKVRNLIFTILLFYIWACMHAGFLIGLFVLFFKLSVDILQLFLNRKKIETSSKTTEFKKIKFLGLTAILSFLVTLITPYGLNLYRFLYDYKNTFYKSHIQEWLSPFTFLPLQYPKLFYTSITIVVIIFILIFEKTSFKEKHIKKIYYWQLLLTIIFIYLSLSSLRHAPLLVISSFFFLTIFIYELFKNCYQYIKLKILNILIIIAMLFFSSYYIISIKTTSNPFNNYCNKYPCEFSKFLNTNSEYKNYKIFNYYTWGGYFIYNHPNMKLFIDGRLPQYSYKNKTILEEYYAFFEEDKTEEKLNEYNINMVIINKKTYLKLDWFEKNILKINENSINNATNNILEYLKNSNCWKILFEDINTIVYTKK